MRFELRSQSDKRKALHVDEEAFAAIRAANDHLDEQDELARILPPEVLDELKQPTYIGPAILFAMDVIVDLTAPKGK